MKKYFIYLNKKNGTTIVELIIGMGLFATIMTITVGFFLVLNKLQTDYTMVANLQEESRTVSEIFARQAREAEVVDIRDTGNNGICSDTDYTSGNYDTVNNGDGSLKRIVFKDYVTLKMKDSTDKLIFFCSQTSTGVGATRYLGLGQTPATFGNTQATATAGISGSVTGVTIGNPGRGCTSNPGIVFSGGGGTGASGFASITGRFGNINYSTRGSGYTLPPTMTFSGGGGTGMSGFVDILGGQVNNTNISNEGSGYTSNPTVTFTGGGATMNAAATIAITNGVAGVTMTSGGSGYTSRPTVSLSGGGCTSFSGTASMSYTLNSINVTNAGSGYTSAPTVTISGGGGIGATATATISTDGLGTIIGINVTNAGSGYTSAPTVTISSPASSSTDLAKLPLLTTSGVSIRNFKITNNTSTYPKTLEYTLEIAKSGIANPTNPLYGESIIMNGYLTMGNQL